MYNFYFVFKLKIRQNPRIIRGFRISESADFKSVEKRISVNLRISNPFKKRISESAVIRGFQADIRGFF